MLRLASLDRSRVGAVLAHVWLVGALLVGCEGQLGGGRGGPVLLGSDAGGPARDAAVPPASDAGATDAFVPRVDAASSPDAYVPPTPGCGTALEQEELALTNAARAMEGLGALRCDATMTGTARGHSTDMCDRSYFSHTGLDGRSPFDRMSDDGVTYRTAGENIAQGQRSPAEVHDAWMHSTGHRANILNPAFGRIGVGLAECGGRYYWTQVFAD